ncbi:MAG: phosphatidylserine decarboxylase family protein [Bacteroidales bacterium]|nr:phosphatidylserine decarboxylase family protein [Bacteroidales bacterium]
MKRIVIDKDCKGTIAGYWTVTIVLVVLAILFIKPLWALIPILVFLAAFAFFVFWFHRLPDRTIPEGDESLVTAVADGKIVVVGKAYEGEYFKEDRIQVSIYMNFFDVHANYWPITGEVSYYKYHPGKYLLAFHPKSSEKNEHSSTTVRNSKGEVFFKQIAGTFARRIVCYSKEGLKVERGKQCGIIKFGSRIDIYLPLDAEILVKEGDLTVGSVTKIARFK